MAQSHSHTPQIMGYMDQYLQKFHDSVQVFSEFRATKKDRQDAKEVSRELAAGQLEARQARLEEYFELSSTQRNRLAVEVHQERARVIQEVQSQPEFNFPKMHLLSHYRSQIKEFGSLPQYSTEITEAPHKSLKNAYRRLNRVDAADQISDTITREQAIHMQE